MTSPFASENYLLESLDAFTAVMGSSRGVFADGGHLLRDKRFVEDESLRLLKLVGEGEFDEAMQALQACQASGDNTAHPGNGFWQMRKISEQVALQVYQDKPWSNALAAAVGNSFYGDMKKSIVESVYLHIRTLIAQTGFDYRLLHNNEWVFGTWKESVIPAMAKELEKDKNSSLYLTQNKDVPKPPNDFDWQPVVFSMLEGTSSENITIENDLAVGTMHMRGRSAYFSAIGYTFYTRDLKVYPRHLQKSY